MDSLLITWAIEKLTLEGDTDSGKRLFDASYQH